MRGGLDPIGLAEKGRQLKGRAQGELAGRGGLVRGGVAGGRLARGGGGLARGGGLAIRYA